MLKEQSEKDENKVQTTSDIESSEDNKERTIIWGMSKTKAWIYMWIC